MSWDPSTLTFPSSTRRPEPPSNSTHETSLPSITSTLDSPTVRLSVPILTFALASSLAACKRLTWEQTGAFHVPPAHRLSPTDISIINQNCLRKQRIHPEALQHALYFGELRGPEVDVSPFSGIQVPAPVTTAGSGSGSRETMPAAPPGEGNYVSLYIVFPYLRRDIFSSSEQIFRTWHDTVILPAFDAGWEESNLPVSSKIHDLYARVPGGFYADEHYVGRIGGGAMRLGERKGRTAEEVVKHVVQRGGRPLRQFFPRWIDEEEIEQKARAGSTGTGTGIGHQEIAACPGSSLMQEGRFSDARAAIYTSIWASITGMLKDHPSFSELQEPKLLLVSKVMRGQEEVAKKLHFDCNDGVCVEEKMVDAARRWDKDVDSRFIVRGSFGLVTQDIVGDEE